MLIDFNLNEKNNLNIDNRMKIKMKTNRNNVIQYFCNDELISEKQSGELE